MRRLNRLGPEVADRLAAGLAPLVQRATDFLAEEMDGRDDPLRADPRLLLLFVYATVVGVATEAEAQRASAWSRHRESLRYRRELFAYVRAAVIASNACSRRYTDSGRSSTAFGTSMGEGAGGEGCGAR